MACNCNTTSQCGNCCAGVPCGCPPDYTVPAQPVDCKCCPGGYTYIPAYAGAAVGKGSNICMDSLGRTTEPIPCVQCVDRVPTDCVVYTGTIPITCAGSSNPNFLPGANIYGINPQDSLTTIISKMCITNEPVIMALLTAIGNSTTLLAGLCNLVGACGPVPGTSTPVIGPITWSIP